jgi:Domain of unknown function (DUF4349)
MPMQPHQQRSHLHQILLSGALGGLLLVGCASQNAGLVSTSEAVAPLESQMAQDNRAAKAGADLAPGSAVAEAEGQSPNQPIPPEESRTTDVAEVVAGTEVSRTPQLVKTAELEVSVEDAPLSIQAAQQIVRQNQGDLLQLQDTVPLSSSLPHQAYLQLRVPYDRLDQTLTQLTALGTVKRQSITAEDVSNQLVDFEARLRNLKKAEESVLKIMERSGEIGDVLKVAQELQTIRENIERITAQLETLKTRVAFSTINLYLVEPVARIPGPDRSWNQELLSAWQTSTRALENSIRAIVVVVIWGVAFSPYLLVFGSGVLIYRRLGKRE